MQIIHKDNLQNIDFDESANKYEVKKFHMTLMKKRRTQDFI